MRGCRPGHPRHAAPSPLRCSDEAQERYNEWQLGELADREDWEEAVPQVCFGGRRQPAFAAGRRMLGRCSCGVVRGAHRGVRPPLTRPVQESQEGDWGDAGEEGVEEGFDS